MMMIIKVWVWFGASLSGAECYNIQDDNKNNARFKAAKLFLERRNMFGEHRMHTFTQEDMQYADIYITRKVECFPTLYPNKNTSG